MGFEFGTILVFDSASKDAYVKDLFGALQKSYSKTIYVDPRKLKKRCFYKTRKNVSKKIRKFFKATQKYYYPKIRNSSITAIFKDINPDIVLVIKYFYKFIDRELLLKLKNEIGFSLYLLDTDSGFEILDHNKFIDYMDYEISVYDQVFSFSKVMVNIVRLSGYKNIQAFSYGAPIVSVDAKLQKKHDIFFVGAANNRRYLHLEKLVNHNLVVYGPEWKSYKKMLSKDLYSKIILQKIWGESLYKLLKQSKIILNINVDVWAALETGVNLRVFEALSVGGFLLTDYCEELNDLFVLGEEVETFRSSDEMADKVDFYLKHDTLREKIARKGGERFLEQYTWEKRAEKMLEYFAKEREV